MNTICEHITDDELVAAAIADLETTRGKCIRPLVAKCQLILTIVSKAYTSEEMFELATDVFSIFNREEETIFRSLYKNSEPLQ